MNYNIKKYNRQEVYKQVEAEYKLPKGLINSTLYVYAYRMSDSEIGYNMEYLYDFPAIYRSGRYVTDNSDEIDWYGLLMTVLSETNFRSDLLLRYKTNKNREKVLETLKTKLLTKLGISLVVGARTTYFSLRDNVVTVPATMLYGVSSSNFSKLTTLLVEILENSITNLNIVFKETDYFNVIKAENKVYLAIGSVDSNVIKIQSSSVCNLTDNRYASSDEISKVCSKLSLTTDLKILKVWNRKSQ